MQAEAQHLFQLPAEPRCRQRKAGRRGEGAPFVCRKVARQRPARAKPERIARGQHRNAPPAQGQNRLDREGHGPFAAPVPDASKAQVPRPAKDDFCRIQGIAACGRQAVQAIFAQTDQGQPGLSHDTHPPAWRHDRGHHARPPSGRGGGGCHLLLRGANRQADGAAPAHAGGGLWRHSGPGGLPARRGDHACGRRNPSLRRPDEHECRSCLRRGGGCIDGTGAPGLARGGGRPLDPCRGHGRRGRCPSVRRGARIPGDRQAACGGFCRETCEFLPSAPG